MLRMTPPFTQGSLGEKANSLPPRAACHTFFQKFFEGFKGDFFYKKVRVRSFRCSSFSSRKRSAGLRLDEMGALDWCIFFVNIVQKRCNLNGLRRFFFLLIKQISQLLSCQTPAWHHQLISNRFLYFPISGTLLALYIVYLAVLFFQSTSANKRRGSTSRSTRTVNPKLGFLGLFGFAGFLGFWTYRVDQTIFPFVFFMFFGFFGFFYEGKMSNTLIDERYKENKMRAQSTANKTALSIIFLQY